MDSVKLVKGENVELQKVAPDMTKVIVGLGWAPAHETKETADLDAMAFLLDANTKVRTKNDFVYYGMDKINGKLATVDGAIVHTGDDLTGGNSEKGDDEQIVVDLNLVSPDIQSIKFLIDIYEAVKKNQNFGLVKDAYVRLLDATNNKEVIRFDLSEDYSAFTDLMAGELYRHNGAWKFRALGEGDTKGAAAHAREFGVTVSQ